MIIMHRRAARGNGAAADICARLIEERLVAAVAALTQEQRGTLRTPDDPRGRCAGQAGRQGPIKQVAPPSPQGARPTLGTP